MMNRNRAAISVLEAAVEHDRRNDVTLRDQAVYSVATPRQAAEFWRRIRQGEAPRQAAEGALALSAFDTEEHEEEWK